MATNLTQSVLAASSCAPENLCPTTGRTPPLTQVLTSSPTKNRSQILAGAQGCVRRYSKDLFAFRRYTAGELGIIRTPFIIPYHVKPSPATNFGQDQRSGVVKTVFPW